MTIDRVTSPRYSPPASIGAEPRRATRSTSDSLVGGVAAGLATHLGLPVRWVRLGFVASGIFGALGLVLYAALWIVLPAEDQFAVSTPGAESAQRQGRVGTQERAGMSETGFVVAFASIVIGLALLIGVMTGTSASMWPIALLTLAAGIVWRQADQAQRERWLDTTGGVGPVKALVGSGGWASYARLLMGLTLLVVAIVMYAAGGAQLSLAREVAVATVLAVLGVGLMLGPWLIRLSSDLTAERAERIRVQERADVAAHLHDSVLQTLALIQRSADDPTSVARLARSQERDLRTWLYAGLPADKSDLASALHDVVASVEDDFDIAVELVVVGAPAFSDALVAATREALINAAKHSGAPSVDVYAEANDEGTAVFVRDRGRGFDQDAVAADRRGVSHSIIDRMARHGGRAEVISSDAGTEVRLYLPKEDS